MDKKLEPTGTGDETLKSKADYVRRQPQNRKHECHWPGCLRQVPPAMWGCKLHWFALPAPLRMRIWKTYRPGQEKTLTPSAQYLEVVQQVQAWIISNPIHPQEGGSQP